MSTLQPKTLGIMRRAVAQWTSSKQTTSHMSARPRAGAEKKATSGRKTFAEPAATWALTARRFSGSRVNFGCAGVTQWK